MLKKIVIYMFIFILGFLAVSLIYKFTSFNSSGLKEHQIIGFLPYWLIDKANKNYDQYLTTLTYFGLTVNGDGTIQEYIKPGEAEPGWYTLKSKKFIPPENLKKSLLIFNGDPEIINQLVSTPTVNANTVISQITPFMTEFNFTDLNLDLESVLPASESARQNFTAFVKQIRTNLNPSITLTIDASPTDLIKTRLINLAEIEPYVDYIVLMTYDFHYAGSMVTGPVAPIGGAGIDSEFDTETGIQKALEIISENKIILGIPLYGYEWETITSNPRAAVIPGSGIVASNRRVEDFLNQCATCSVQMESIAQESYLTYFAPETKTYHQIFYPDTQAIQAKIKLAKKYDLAGIAFWALGYDGQTILNPVTTYKSLLK